MARSLVFVALSALLPVGFAFADPSASPQPTASPTPAPDHAKRKGSAPHDDWEGPLRRFHDKIEELGPKERDQFRENWQRWKSMGSDEKSEMRQRAAADRDRVKKCINDAIDQTGLRLNRDQREVFALRYRQERRKIEVQLSKEMDAERKKKIDGMLTELKSEFSSVTKPGHRAKDAAPSPSPSPAD